MLALLVCLLAGASPTKEMAMPRGIILVTIDTLRADRLGAYGYTRTSSPFLDRLAREGVLFESAFSAAVQTSPAHAALFTGLYPSQIGVRSNGQGLADAGRGFSTLAETLRAAGFATGAVSAVNFLKPITRGFDTVELGHEVKSYRPADRTVDRAAAWLGARGAGERFFLWLHLFDPHLPNRAPPELASRLGFESSAVARAWGEGLLALRPALSATYRSAAEIANRYAAYDAEVAFADRELQRLFESQKVRDGDTLWIVTADHGEGLGDHGYDGHGPYLYDEVLRVPLIVWFGGRFAGTRVRGLVRHVDLLPTLVAWSGVSHPAPRGFTVPGQSLLDTIRDGVPLAPRVAFAQRRPPGPKLRHFEPGEVFAVRTSDHKYIVRTATKDELYDLRSDPLEARNLAAEPLPIRERLERLARETYAQASREGSGVLATPVSPETDEELRALGYVQ